MKVFQIVFFVSIILLFASCSNIIKQAYGIKDVKHLNTDTIKHYIAINDVMKQHQNYYVDSNYLNGMYLKFSNDTVMASHLCQPIQAMYFDSLGNLVSYHINCNAGGFPNLKWNRNNVFANYPPSTQTSCSPSVKYDSTKSYFKYVYNKVQPVQRKEKIVIFWSIILYKQSESLITLVMQNLKEHHKENNVEIEFVNTDYLYQ